MHRDALTTAANLGAFVRFIFIHPMRDKGMDRAAVATKCACATDTC